MELVRRAGRQHGEEPHPGARSAISSSRRRGLAAVPRSDRPPRLQAANVRRFAPARRRSATSGGLSSTTATSSEGSVPSTMPGRGTDRDGSVMGDTGTGAERAAATAPTPRADQLSFARTCRGVTGGCPMPTRDRGAQAAAPDPRSRASPGSRAPLSVDAAAARRSARARRGRRTAVAAAARVPRWSRRWRWRGDSASRPPRPQIPARRRTQRPLEWGRPSGPGGAGHATIRCRAARVRGGRARSTVRARGRTCTSCCGRPGCGARSRYTLLTCGECLRPRHASSKPASGGDVRDHAPRSTPRRRARHSAGRRMRRRRRARRRRPMPAEGRPIAPAVRAGDRSGAESRCGGQLIEAPARADAVVAERAASTIPDAGRSAGDCTGSSSRSALAAAVVPRG